MNFCKLCQARLTTNRGFFEELELCYKCEEKLPGLVEFKEEFKEFEKRSLERKKKINKLQDRVDENNLQISRTIDKIIKGEEWR